MIQTNATASYVPSYKVLGYRVISGHLKATAAFTVMAMREVERPPFYSDVTITEDFVIFTPKPLSKTLINGPTVGGGVAG